MSWTYKNIELLDEMIPPKAQGFIYILTYVPTGQRYIGRKLLTKAHRRQKDKKIIRSRIESDWKTYWSSSPEILSIIASEGTDNFIREVLVFADTKGQLNYLEECLQYTLGVLESDKWLNSNIRSKSYKRNILDKDSIKDMRSFINEHITSTGTNSLYIFNKTN
jgi:hypothetical protein